MPAAMNVYEIGLLKALYRAVGCGPLDRLFAVVTRLGNGGAVWIALTVLLLLFPKTRRIALAMALAMALCLLFGNFVLKPLIARPRPYQVDPAISLRIPPPIEFSFPSGHSMNGFAAALSLRLRCRAAGRTALCLAALIAFSRLYFLVHYPTDVLCGAALGCAAALAADRIVAALAARKERVRHG